MCVYIYIYIYMRVYMYIYMYICVLTLCKHWAWIDQLWKSLQASDAASYANQFGTHCYWLLHRAMTEHALRQKRWLGQQSALQEVKTSCALVTPGALQKIHKGIRRGKDSGKLHPLNMRSWPESGGPQEMQDLCRETARAANTHGNGLEVNVALLIPCF